MANFTLSGVEKAGTISCLHGQYVVLISITTVPYQKYYTSHIPRFHHQSFFTGRACPPLETQTNPK